MRVQPAAARKFDLPLVRFPLRGQTGAGGFPPRRKARCAPANCAGSPRARGSPHKRAPPPCVSPAAFAVLRSFARLRPAHFFHYFPSLLQTDKKVLSDNLLATTES